ncbi:MAG: hypothetical protein MZU95_09700 [Desulfomicrobium escambiense]|nr:hypothetical protein [Desulfomicrobium escambiense]
MGCRVVMPRQTCCGLPALGNGDLDMARKYALKNAAVLTSFINKGFDVVYACTSCGLTPYAGLPGYPRRHRGKEDCREHLQRERVPALPAAGG